MIDRLLGRAALILVAAGGGLALHLIGREIVH